MSDLRKFAERLINVDCKSVEKNGKTPGGRVRYCCRSSPGFGERQSDAGVKSLQSGKTADSD